MRLWNPDKYEWLITDANDTTTKGTDCAYDRFVWSKAAAASMSVVSEAMVFDFGTFYGLTYDETVAVSDHYPIELKLTTAGTKATAPSVYEHASIESQAARRVDMCLAATMLWAGGVAALAVTAVLNER